MEAALLTKPAFCSVCRLSHPTHSLSFLCFLLQTLGHIGKVIKVFGGGDLRVSFSGQSWTFNPACLTAYQREDDANLMTTEDAKESKSESMQLHLLKPRLHHTCVGNLQC